VRKLLDIIAFADILAFVGGILYVVINGALPPMVADGLNSMRTAGLIVLVILAIPALWLTVLIYQSQKEPPYESRN
jgi:hypothetical protein